MTARLVRGKTQRTCPAGICPRNFRVHRLNVSPEIADVLIGEEVVVPSALPAEGAGLRQSDVSQHAAGKLAGHGIERSRPVIERWDQRKDSRTRVGGTVEVADVNFVERRF